MLSALKNLWKICFDDTDEYIDHYFTQRYSAEHTLVHTERGNIVAMMTLLPATIVTPNKKYNGRYLYAVATSPAYRRKGIASALTRHASQVMQAQGVDVAIVVPASPELFTFYARQGYVTGIYRRTVTFYADEIPANNAPQGQPLTDADKFYALREQHFGQCDCFVRWDVAALSYILAECRLSGGHPFYFTNGHEEGYILTEPKDDTLLIKEAACSPTFAPRLLSFLKNHYPHFSRFTFHLPINTPLWNDRGREEPVAMLQWFSENPPKTPAGNAYIGLLKD